MRSKNIYMIGIKGVGMTMLAQFLAYQGHKVSGSDISDVFLTDQVLIKSGILIKSPFKKVNLPEKVDMVIYSSAFNEDNNVELKQLFSFKGEKYKKTEILSYAQALGNIFNNHKGIAVCGSHGKTTVSAWLGFVLHKSGKSPNVLVGSRVPQLNGSSLCGKSKLFVAEVDEYQNKLQYFVPHGVVLNNIDFDHPDFFKTEEEYFKVFKDFVKKIPNKGFLVVNGEDEKITKLLKSCKGQVISYGLLNENGSTRTYNYLAYDLKSKGSCQLFKVNNLGEFKIKLWGRHNILNALAVIATARELKLPLVKIKKYLAEFSGTARRAEVLGEYKKALIIDDYAHHPTEIKTTIDGIRARYPKKNLRVVFHPHTYTRTKALFSDFLNSFDLADELIILDIYGSAREKQGGVSSLKLARAISKNNKEKKIKQKVSNLKEIKDVSLYLKKTVLKDDLILLMGAGDVFRVADNLLKRKK